MISSFRLRSARGDIVAAFSVALTSMNDTRGECIWLVIVTMSYSEVMTGANVGQKEHYVYPRSADIHQGLIYIVSEIFRLHYKISIASAAGDLLHDPRN